jgi:hypothetical protein
VLFIGLAQYKNGEWNKNVYIMREH